MKNLIKTTCLITTFVLITSCKKKDSTSSPTTTTPPPAPSDNYTSMAAFFSKNGVAMQSYTVNASTGGSFTSPQGTTVSIPANAFVTQGGMAVTGAVTIQFKDIYKKSDMLLSKMPTMMYSGAPLKSGGEFFIKAIQNNNALMMASGQRISVSQPGALTGGIDYNQQAYVVPNDSLIKLWTPTSNNGIDSSGIARYIYNIYSMNAPADSGSWCNTDNPYFFSAYTQSSLSVTTSDSTNIYGTQVFLVFKSISSMISFDENITKTSFTYNYAPVGLQCTIVAVGVKGGALYSSFTPITISANQSVSFTLTPTTTSTFTNALTALN